MMTLLCRHHRRHHAPGIKCCLRFPLSLLILSDSLPAYCAGKAQPLSQAPEQDQRNYPVHGAMLSALSQPLEEVAVAGIALWGQEGRPSGKEWLYLQGPCRPRGR